MFADDVQIYSQYGVVLSKIKLKSIFDFTLYILLYRLKVINNKSKLIVIYKTLIFTI